MTILVGGVNLSAVFFNMQRQPNRYNRAIEGGIILSGWIVMQMILINAVYRLHLLYPVVGILVILPAYRLKGKWAA